MIKLIYKWTQWTTQPGRKRFPRVVRNLAGLNAACMAILLGLGILAAIASGWRARKKR